MKVAIQGYRGSFHQIVANRYFGNDVEIVDCIHFRDVARAVERGEVDYGVMAIENSIAGSILPNYSILQNDNLQVAGEAYLQIVHNLMVLPGVKIEDIEEVQSHQMALLQCTDFLDEHSWRLIEAQDTAWSARQVAERGLTHTAAIASDLSAKIFGLEIVAPGINTMKNNYTRFVIIKRHDHRIEPDANKASLYFTTDHRHGSLIRVLNQIQDSMINLSKLQSYPVPSDPWHYLFHVDMEFETLDDYMRVLERLQHTAEKVHVYGVYKKGDPSGADIAPEIIESV